MEEDEVNAAVVSVGTAADVRAIIECYRETLHTPYHGNIKVILEEAKGCFWEQDFRNLRDGLYAARLSWSWQQVLGLHSDE